MDLDDILLRPASLLRQTIMILLDPGVHQTLLLERGEYEVGEGGGGVSGGAPGHLVIATPSSLTYTSSSGYPSPGVDHRSL